MTDERHNSVNRVNYDINISTLTLFNKIGARGSETSSPNSCRDVCRPPPVTRPPDAGKHIDKGTLR